jgi:hypothetical protein
MYSDWDYILYRAVKLATGHGEGRDLDAYSGMQFVEQVEKRDPQLVAACRCKLRMGVST